SHRAVLAAQQAHVRPTVAQLGHPSRLVFVIPANAEIRFSLDGLLEWSNLELSVTGTAALGDTPTEDQIANAPAIQEPGSNHTAIELPYRLVISPTREVTWLHRWQPFTSRGRTELWHTRLALKAANGVVTELSRTTPAPLRAIWSPDYDPANLPFIVEDPQLGRTAMNNNDRHQLVVLTSAFDGYEVKHVVRFRRKAPATVYVRYVPQPFHADRLMLSSLGGWLRSRGEWEPPRRRPPTVFPSLDLSQLLQTIRVSRRDALPVAEA